MSKTLYIFSSGQLRRRENTLCVITKDKKHYLPVTNVSDIFIFGEVEINKRILEFLTRNKIPVHFFNRDGYYIGTYYPREYLNSGYMLLKQAEHYLDPDKRIQIARKLVKGSITNILKVLSYYRNRLSDKNLDALIESITSYVPELAKCKTTEQLMAIEGNARETYYSAFDIILKNSDFMFNKRTKRPPQNRLNALISFGNSFLYTVCLSEIYKTHMDPRIGFLHATNFRRFSLNLDIAEIFKPIIVDRAIFTVINKKIIKASHFENKTGGIILNEAGKRAFVSALEERLNSTIKHRSLGRNVSYRTLIRMEVYKLEKHLLGDREYEPFISRW